MKEYIPYVYIIKNRTTGLKYIGVEYSKIKKIANPCNLWTIYFTSSSIVHKLIDEFGVDDFIVKVLHTYPGDAKSAVEREARYFRYIKERSDYLNMCYSSGIQDLRIASKAGKVGGAIAKNRKVGIHDPIKRFEYYSLGGKASAATQMKNKIGIHSQTKEERLIFASMGGRASGQFQNKEFQSEMGKRGGIKNRGFIWYNDGSNCFKYTLKQQKKKSFNDFMLENKSFSPGRVNLKKIECPHCHKIGLPGPMKRHHFTNCRKNK